VVLDSLEQAVGVDDDEDLALATADEIELTLDDLDAPELGAVAETL